MNFNPRLVLRLSFAGLLLILACAPGSLAQSSSAFHEKVTHFYHDRTPTPSRDFWFAPAMLYDQAFERTTLLICVTAKHNTTAYIQIADSSVRQLPILGSSMTSFQIPSSWVILSSSVVENKGIHLWSNDADLNAIVVCHEPYSGDAMHLIPTNELGTDYVVAASAGFINQFGGYDDIPSEFVVVATHDSTIVSITPNADLRKELTPGSGKWVFHPRGFPFTELLERGQAIQYESSENWNNTDVTGTYIHSNYNVAVIGANQIGGVPVNWPYEDFLCEMLPPLDGWGKLYYTAPFKGAQGGSTYLTIGSVPNQLIYRTDTADGKTLFCKLGPQFDTSLNYDIKLPSKWESDAPFLLVQYMNSSTYPDGVEGIGAPCMAVVPPVERFSDSAMFVVPDTNQSLYQTPNSYDWYVTAIVNRHSNSPTFDGHDLRLYGWYAIDSSYSACIIPHVLPGAHTVLADSGVGVVGYGYGYDESMAYGVNPGLGATMSFAFIEEGNCLRVAIADSLSRIASIRLDTLIGFSFEADPNFTAGVSLATYAQLCTTGKLCRDTARFVVTDIHANRSEIEVTSTALPLSVPKNMDFDSVLVGSVKHDSVTVSNNSSCPDTVTALWLPFPQTAYQNSFEIDSQFLAANPLPYSLPPGASRNIALTFTPWVATRLFGVLALAQSDGQVLQVALTGTGVTPAEVHETPTTTGYASLVSISPNPAGKSLTLSYSSNHPSPTAFEVFTLLGTSVFRWHGGADAAGQQRETFDVSTLVEGSYIYRFDCAGEVTSGKLSIAR